MKTRTGYLIKRGKNYYAVWTVAGKKFTQTTKKSTIRAAKSELARIMEPYLIENEKRMLEHVKGRIEGANEELAAFDDAKNPPPTLLASWDMYLEAPNRKDSGEVTLQQYESHFDQFCGWLKKNHAEINALRDVTPELASEYAKHLNKRGLSANRFNKHIRFLATLFKVLNKKARLTCNPWLEINRKRQVPNSRRELTVEELQNVCKAAQGELRKLFALGLYTGLRLGDCSTLRWAEVDLERGQIRRIPNKTARRNPKPVLVPIHPVLKNILAEARTPGHGEYVFPEIAAEYIKTPSELTRKIQKLFTDCGVMTTKPGTGVEIVTDEDGQEHKKPTGKRAVVEVGFHSLRHSFVSLCRESNAPLSVVQSIVGHSSPAMTQHYTHVGELAAGQAVSLLPDITGTAKALPPAPDTFSKKAVNKLAKSMTGKNWKTIKAELLKISATE